MQYQVNARTMCGSTIGAFVDTARDALLKANAFLDDGLTDITFYDENGNPIDVETIQALASRVMK